MYALAVIVYKIYVFRRSSRARDGSTRDEETSLSVCPEYVDAYTRVALAVLGTTASGLQ
jgi:hypothetical protein